MTKPKFKIGFELEAAIVDSIEPIFDDGLAALDSRICRGRDGSVEGGGLKRIYGDSYDGIEIRTPPLPLDEGLKLFEKVLHYMAEWSGKGSLATNSTCGLHVNVSEPVMAERFDLFCKFYAHIATHFPEQEVLKMFNRTTNTYCHPLFTRGGQKKADYLELQALAMEGEFGTHKYHSVGLHNGRKSSGFSPDDRRIEFRCLGNKNYHLATDKLGRAVDLIISSMQYGFDMCVNPPADERTAGEILKEMEEHGIDIPCYIACSN